MAWFKVDDKLHSAPKLLSIPRKYRLAALGLWTISGSWSADQLTDGKVPDYMVEEWGGTKALVEWLVKSGLWVKVDDASQFKNWGEYQPTRADIEAEREKNREKLRKWRERNQGSNSDVTGLQTGYEPDSNPAPDPTRPDPTPIEEAKASSVEIREDVQGLCELLANLIEANGSKRPKINKTWTDSARRMIDLDDREPERAANLIRWSQANTFWRKNILSMPTFREKYDQLRLAALEDWEKNKAGASPDGEIDVDAVLGRDVWTPGAPPAGLSVAEEIEWKKQQRAAHKAARLEEAKKKLGVAA